MDGGVCPDAVAKVAVRPNSLGQPVVEVQRVAIDSRPGLRCLVHGVGHGAAAEVALPKVHRDLRRLAEVQPQAVGDAGGDIGEQRGIRVDITVVATVDGRAAVGGVGVIGIAVAADSLGSQLGCWQQIVAAIGHLGSTAKHTGKRRTVGSSVTVIYIVRLAYPRITTVVSIKIGDDVVAGVHQLVDWLNHPGGGAVDRRVVVPFIADVLIGRNLGDGLGRGNVGWRRGAPGIADNQAAGQGVWHYRCAQVAVGIALVYRHCRRDSMVGAVAVDDARCAAGGNLQYAAVEQLGVTAVRGGDLGVEGQGRRVLRHDIGDFPHDALATDGQTGSGVRRRAGWVDDTHRTRDDGQTVGQTVIEDGLLDAVQGADHKAVAHRVVAANADTMVAPTVAAHHQGNCAVCGHNHLAEYDAHRAVVQVVGIDQHPWGTHGVINRAIGIAAESAAPERWASGIAVVQRHTHTMRSPVLVPVAVVAVLVAVAHIMAYRDAEILIDAFRQTVADF